MKKHIPLRTCILTKESLPKKDLLRIVVYNDSVSIDPKGKSNGRGYYLKKDIEVIKIAISKKSLDKTLKIKISDDFYRELLAYALSNYGENQ